MLCFDGQFIPSKVEQEVQHLIENLSKSEVIQSQNFVSSPCIPDAVLTSLSLGLMNEREQSLLISKLGLPFLVFVSITILYGMAIGLGYLNSNLKKQYLASLVFTFTKLILIVISQGNIQFEYWNKHLEERLGQNYTWVI